jgi:periplasmic divalent cation tolerance protein
MPREGVGTAVLEAARGGGMGDEVVVLITSATPEEAGTIATALVNEHLAACVNIIPGVRSFFFWEGRTQEAAETLMVCKSRLPLMEQLVDRVKSLHSYSVPEVIALPVIAGLDSYLSWIRDSTRS